MSQNDMTVDNSTGANVRADINSALQALASNNSGSSAPSTTFATQFFADTNAGILKLRNTSNNGYVNLFTLAGGVDVDAASNFNEDVTFTGASANIVFDKSDNSLEFIDNAKAKFGTGDDLAIFHDGSNSFIEDSGSGSLFIRGTDLILEDRDGFDYITCNDTGNGGTVTLKHNASTVFATASGGVSLTGALNFDNSTSMSGLVADLWRSTTDHAGNTSPLPNWERPDSGNQGNISGVTVSSGVFTFPKTGMYLVQFFCTMFLDNVTTASQRNTASIMVTTNNSSFTTAAQGHVNFGGGGFSTSVDTQATASCAALLDIRDLSNHKVRFDFGAGQGHEKVQGNSTLNATYATFTLMGDT